MSRITGHFSSWITRLVPGSSCSTCRACVHIQYSLQSELMCI
jgi:hypothetical protein